VVTAYRHALSKQQLALRRAFRQAAVSANDSVPGDVMCRCQDATDEPRRPWIDVAVRAYEPLGDRAHAGDDASGSRLGTPRLRAWHRHIMKKGGALPTSLPPTEALGAF
jgi:hypothetical protein